MRITE